MSMKNPVTTPRIDPGTVRLVAQYLNHYATPGPFQICGSFNLYGISCKSPTWTVKLEATILAAVSVTTYQSVRRRSPEYLFLRQQRYNNLKSHIVWYYLAILSSKFAFNCDLIIIVFEKIVLQEYIYPCKPKYPLCSHHTFSQRKTWGCNRGVSAFFFYFLL
jgi:hypothetical protein